MQFQENVSLKPFNTFGIDASAKYFSIFSNVEDLKELLAETKKKNTSLLVLGGGSNILFTQNVNGFVLKNSIKGVALVKQTEEHYFIKAAAGEVWHEFVLHCIKNNYAGLENLSLIPGCVGASPMQNIGAYGVEIKDNFESLEAIEVSTGNMATFSKSDCKFGYRESVFKRELKDRYIITSVTFKLNKKPIFNTSYGAIEKELESMAVKELSIKAISDAVCNIRRSKLPDPTQIGNAGSFFKNPEVDKKVYEQILNQNSDAVGYPLENGNVKLAAGWLIEKCGWKGKTIGEAGVHKNQALVLVNYGKAKGNEIFDLSEKIIASVNQTFGVTLEREVNII